MITIPELKRKLTKDSRWQQRAITVLYEYQTYAERDWKETCELNGVGFNGADAYILSSFAQQINAGRTLSEKQRAIASKKLPKYAGQLLRIAKDKAAD